MVRHFQVIDFLKFFSITIESRKNLKVEHLLMTNTSIRH